ncbi:MAG: peptidoglycan DD-metalloendopeptidase family protein [Nitrosomonadaceae bacterium]
MKSAILIFANMWLNTFLRLVFLCILLLSHALYAAPEASKKNLGQLREHIESLQKDLENKEESKSEVSDSLRETEQAISKISRELAELTHEQYEVQNKLYQLQKKLDLIKNKILAQQTYLSKLLYQQYIGGKHEYFRLLLNQQNPSQLAREMYYYVYLSRARAKNINTLRVNLEKLRAIVHESNEKTTEITLIQAKQDGQKQLLEQEEIKYKELLTSISKEVDQGRRKISKLKRDEKRLSRLVEKIGKRKLRSHKDRPTTLRSNSLPDALVDRKEFSSLKGLLSLPIRGEIINRFGGPRSNGGITWKGLFIRSTIGKNVKAIAYGQVVFADWLRGFGNILIVDHGDGYMSLYGNNHILAKKVGDTIHGGDTIAIVGNSGGNPDSGLYFELRHKGKPFDPLKWVKLK